MQVPGRVGDAAVPGAGAYADSEVGGCGATGDGDVHMRFLPCYQVLTPCTPSDGQNIEGLLAGSTSAWMHLCMDHVFMWVLWINTLPSYCVPSYDLCDLAVYPHAKGDWFS